jgi:hypothetical protein
MTERNDTGHSDSPRNWDSYSQMLRRLPEQELPDGFTARLDSAVRRHDSRQAKARKRLWLITAPAFTLTAIVLAVWLGNSALTENSIHKSDSIVAVTQKAPASKSHRSRGRSRGEMGRTAPVLPLSETPAPPTIAAAPASLDSMIRELHETVERGAVTGGPRHELVPGAYFPRGAVAVLIQ